MYRGKTIAVVIPCFNEELLIERVLRTMPGFVDTLIVVDDNSTDSTAAIVEHCASDFGERLVLLRHRRNRGVGAALVSGYRQSRKLGRDVTVVMNGDAQMDPLDLPALLDPIVSGRADYSKGNRLFGGRAWEQIPHVRYMGNAVLSLFTKIASGYWHVADSQSGYTAITLQALKTLRLNHVYKDYGVPNDLLVRLNVENFRVQDVPVKPIYNIGEKSGIRYRKVIPRISWLLLRLFFWRLQEKYIIRDFHPLVFFYFFGLTLLPVGLLLGFYLLWLRIHYGPAPVTFTSALFACLLIISGLQFLFFAMWFDMERNKELKCL